MMSFVSCDVARRAAQGAVVFQPPTVQMRRSRQPRLLDFCGKSRP